MRFPPPGQLIDVGGYRLHLNCRGIGEHTVILESGHGGNSLEWYHVQSELEKFTRVCSYDRAGYGWSEESPSPRTSLQFIHELHTALSKAQIPKPYILVGHSLGGINVRLFAHHFPDEVAGIVLVDSSHEDQTARCPKEPEESFFLRNPKISLWLTYCGIHRLIMNLSHVQTMLMLNFYPDSIRKMYVAKLSSNSSIRTALRETASIEESLNQLKEVNFSFEDKPLIVLTAGMSGSAKEYNVPQEWLDETHKVWQILQCELTNQSSRGKQITVHESDHMITRRKPKVIVDSILEIINILSFENITPTK